MELIKVRAESNVQQVAGSIAKALENSETITVRAVGASAVSQAAKSIAIARGLIAPRAQDLFTRIGFANVESQNGEGSISAVVFQLEVR